MFVSQKGYTLLELLLVLVVAASIILMGVRFLQQRQRWQSGFSQMQDSVQTIVKASKNYFFMQCQGWSFPFAEKSVTEKDLITQGLLQKNSNVANPWGQPFQVVIDGTTRPILIKVSAVMDKLPGSAADYNYYGRLLSATVNNNTLTWTTTVNIETDKAQKNLWVLSQSLRYFTKSSQTSAASNACLG